MQKGLFLWYRAVPLLFFYGFLFLFCLIPDASAQIIRAFAGNGSENVPATTAHLATPYGVAVDGSGNLYIADQNNHRIRKVSPSGEVTTVAGNRIPGFSGDGGQATSAQLSTPTSVIVDGLGNLYIADRGNNRIRRVGTTGVISTVSGTITAGYSGDGGPAANAQLDSPSSVVRDASGNLYIADTGNHRIRKISTSGVITTVAGSSTAGHGGDGGPATSAQLYVPSGIAVDGSGNLYIADYFNHRIRKVNTSGVISTIAGTGTAGYNGDGIAATTAQLRNPTKLTVDASGNLYIADQFSHRVRKVNPSGIISTVAGTGTLGYSGDGLAATSAQVYNPSDVALDGSGNLYIADSQNNRIRKVSTTGVISTVAGTGIYADAGFSGDGGAATSAQLYLPRSMVMDGSGNVYIADQKNHRIRRVSPGGIITTVAGTGTSGYSGDGGAATSAQLDDPVSLALDGNGNLYIADQSSNCIRKVNSSGVISTMAGTGTSGFSGDGGLATSAQLNFPNSLAMDGSGNLYISDLYNNRIRKVNSSGIISTIAGTGIFGFSGDSGPATSAQLAQPTGVALDGNENLYITDSQNHRIRKVSTTGVISTVAGTGTSGFSGDGGPATSARLASPTSIAADGSGNLYVATNNRIRRVGATGIISTVAGTGTTGFSGNGGAAVSAQFYTPMGVMIDSLGNLYIADYYNHRVRKVDGPPSVRITPTSPSAVCWPGTFSLTATAANFTPNSYSWSSQPAGLSATGATPTFTVPKLTSATTYTITVIASDGSRTAPSSVTLVVNEATSAGLITSGTLTCAQTSVSVTASGGGTYQFSGPGIVSQSGNVATVNIGGTYSVTATAVNGCTVTASTTVSSNTAAPSATLSASGTLTCSQTSVTLTAGGGTTYQFSGPGLVSQSGNVALVNQAGTYSVVVTSANGCTASSSLTVGYQNCPPTVANVIPTQSATATVAFSMSISANTFTDPETPNSLTLSVSGLPSGLSFVAPNTISGILSSSVGSPFSVSVTATDSGGLTASTSFSLTVHHAPNCPQMVTVKVGDWNDPSVWSCGRVPAVTDVVTISHVVNLPASYIGKALRVIYTGTGRVLLNGSSRLKLAVE
ncbi:hypothetical protein GCM10028807_20710 [Spirosoma daeguense]